MTEEQKQIVRYTLQYVRKFRYAQGYTDDNVIDWIERNYFE